MHAQKLPAAAGWRWLDAGFAIFRRNPPLLSMLVVSYWLTVIFLNLIPIIGAVAASMVIPGLTVGLMQAARDLEQGKPVGLQTLFGGIKQARPAAPPQANFFADPSGAQQGAPAPRMGGSGPAFCVRGCDGKYFPVHARGNATAAQPGRADATCTS